MRAEVGSAEGITSGKALQFPQRLIHGLRGAEKFALKPARRHSRILGRHMPDQRLLAHVYSP
ncbi:hypothetical protein [Marinoscillum sp.]|uniref:hypothetical protein n=1 Tax=Marinoscillum sp. TaxID=2024838 RepID=UPI003BAA3107